MKMPDWIKRLFATMSKAAKAAWARWEQVLTSERKLFLADMMASAAPIIQDMQRTEMTGAQKREYVQQQLVGIATRHALVAAGRIVAGEVNNLINTAIEQQVLVEKSSV
ncbi:MAG: hypothetical protein WBC06_09175 [Chitinophagaceae bacterium]